MNRLLAFASLAEVRRPKWGQLRTGSSTGGRAGLIGALELARGALLDDMFGPMP